MGSTFEQRNAQPVSSHLLFGFCTNLVRFRFSSLNKLVERTAGVRTYCHCQSFCCQKLMDSAGDRTSNIGALRWIPQGLTRARDSSAVAPSPRTARVAPVFLAFRVSRFTNVSSWSNGWIEDSPFGGQQKRFKNPRTLFFES